VSGLSLVVFLSVGHYPFYGSHDLIIVKAYRYWFSLWGFSRGFYTKIFVLCAIFLFPCICLGCMFS
jgi:hypothetical protein